MEEVKDERSNEMDDEQMKKTKNSAIEMESMMGRHQYSDEDEYYESDVTYRVIFFKWGKVLRHQILIMQFEDKPKLVYTCKLFDI